MKVRPDTARRFLVPTDVDAAASAWIARRDAGMTVGEREEFARWSTRPEHADALSRHEKTWSIFDRPAQGGEGATLMRKVRRRVAQRRRRQLGAALAVASVFIAGVIWHRAPWATPALSVPPAPTAVVVLPEKRTLPDGSVVELKAGATLSLEFTGQYRRVALQRGEAHFQVTKDAARPFVVAVAGVEVRAVGTAFMVGLDQVGVAVLVTEGRVAVNRPGNNAAPASPDPASPAPADPRALGMVDAGNQIVVNLMPASVAGLPPIVPVSAKEIAEKLAWRAPRLEFTGARLADAVALMNRHSQVRIVIEDSSLNDLEVSGYFRADNAATFLHLIEHGLGVRSESRGTTILLRKAP